MNKWHLVSKEVASNHALYGYKGWLKATLAYITVTGLIAITMIFTGSYKNTSSSIWYFLPPVFFTPLFIYSAFNVGKFFRYGAGSYYLIEGGFRIYTMLLMSNQIHVNFTQILTNTIPVIIGLYIFLSKRVKVTVCHELPLDTPANADTSSSEEYLYAQVANELEGAELNKGLWTKLYAELEGDEVKTKVAYIKQRMMSLKNNQYLDKPLPKNVDDDIPKPDEIKNSELKKLFFGMAILSAVVFIIFIANRPGRQHQNINEEKIEQPTISNYTDPRSSEEDYFKNLNDSVFSQYEPAKIAPTSYIDEIDCQCLFRSAPQFACRSAPV